MVRSGRPGATEDMPAFSQTELSDDDVAAIQGHLLTLCPTATVTGAELLAGNCASCHEPPSVRCATRVADAVRVGRATVMPAFPVTTMPNSELQRLIDTLSALCAAAGRPAADLFAGNCQSCHGANAAGSTSALGVSGVDIRCADTSQFVDHVRNGAGEMPPFPLLSDADATSIHDWVFTSFCPLAP